MLYPPGSVPAGACNTDKKTQHLAMYLNLFRSNSHLWSLPDYPAERHTVGADLWPAHVVAECTWAGVPEMQG